MRDDEGNVMKQIEAREDKVQSEKCYWRLQLSWITKDMKHFLDTS